MTEKEQKFLADISLAIQLIESFVIDIHSFEQYIKDQKTKSAVERQLGIIGEAVNKLLKESNNNHLESAVQIISLRNRLIHSYDNIDDSIIWTIITRYLVPLKQEIKEKIEKF